MELGIFVACVAAVILALTLYFAATKAINKHAETRYAYTPITIGKALFAVVPWCVLVAGIFMGGDNVIVGFMVAVLLFVALAWSIAAKSSASVAFGATILLVVAGAGLVVLMLIALLVFGKKSDGDVGKT